MIVASKTSLLGYLVAGFYVFLTLLPDSNTVTVSWPWVLIWQVGLACPVLWLLYQVGLDRQFQRLGQGWDWLVLALLGGLFLSTTFAEFPDQARWYSWVAICWVAALYALNHWLQVSYRRQALLTAQGYLTIAFILVSLGLWVPQTLLPELARLQSLQSLGLSLPFIFSPETRNWAPIGHANYVAGYLVLTLPLLLSLALGQPGWRRWLWGTGLLLGVIDLYTTNSRVGWLALAIVGGLGLGLWGWSRIGRRWRWLVLASAALIFGLGLVTNSRFSILLNAVFKGGAVDTYRTITIATGWNLWKAHPWLGSGPGSVALLYQQYRPSWAGREAEWTYQLHSTPIQILAELGLWGAVTGLAGLALLGYGGWQLWRSRDRGPDSLPPQLWGSLYAGLLGYGLVSLTDYQLDNVCISGVLVILLSVLTAELPGRPEPIELSSRQAKVWAGAGLGLGAIVAFWLWPIHWAWNLSSQGFAALSRADLPAFEQALNRAQQLARWEPYYPYQLGWNLGDRSLTSRDPNQQRSLRMAAIPAFQKGLQAAPYSEFGHTNLGWLLLAQQPPAAVSEFARSTQLMLGKRGVFYSLGVALLANAQPNLAVEALTLEVVQDPLFITSPLWQLPPLQALYPAVIRQIEQRYQELLARSATAPQLQQYWHQVRGNLRWWWGDLVGAAADLANTGSPLSQIILAMAQGQPVPTSFQPLLLPLNLTDRPDAGLLTIAAWLDPAQRTTRLQQAWAVKTRTVMPPPLLSAAITGMQQARTLDQWVKSAVPPIELRRERQGFGVISRHIDGPAPRDFLVVLENPIMSNLLEELFPSMVYTAETDPLLRTWRDQLLAAIPSTLK